MVLFIQRAKCLMSLFKPCSTIIDLTQIHGLVLKSGFDQDLFVMAKIIELCVVLGEMGYGASVFDSIQNPDGFLFNTMIRGFGETDHPKTAIDLYKRMRTMQEKQVFADSFTFSFLFRVSWRLGSDILGKQLHACSLKHGLNTQVFVTNTLIHTYGLSGEIRNAVKLFAEMPERDLVSWNTMIGTLAHSQNPMEALRLFSEMLVRRECFRPNDATFVAILYASQSLDIVQRIHALAVVSGLETVISVSNSVIHAYAKHGAIDDASVAFNRIQCDKKTTVSWNAVILALATNGRECDALSMFEKMAAYDSLTPDGITFLGVLCACGRAGFVVEGRQYFGIMRQVYQIEPTLKHFGCMVDLLGRAGLVDEAYEVIESMPFEGNSVIWRALLSACGVHRNVEIGEKAKEHLSRLEPDHSGDYVLMANIYADSGRWNEVIRVRESMRERRVWKAEPGFSLIGNSFA